MGFVKRPLYLEGHGDLVSGLILGIIGVIIWLTGVINLLTKSPRPSKYDPCPIPDRLSGVLKVLVGG